MEERSTVEYTVKEEDLNDLLNLPLATSSIIAFTYLENSHIASFHSWLQRSKCRRVILMIDKDLTIDAIRRTCKACSQFKVHLDFSASPQSKIFTELVEKYQAKADKKDKKDKEDRHHGRANKRRAHIDRREKLKKMLKKCMKLAEKVVDVDLLMEDSASVV